MPASAIDRQRIAVAGLGQIIDLDGHDSNQYKTMNVAASMKEGVFHLKQRASEALAQGQAQTAIQLLDEAIAAHVADGSHARHAHILSVLLSNRAAAHAQQGDHQKCCSDAELAIQQDASWHKPYLRHAAALLALNRPRDALQTLEEGIRNCCKEHNTEHSGMVLNDDDPVQRLLIAKQDVQVALASQARSRKRKTGVDSSSVDTSVDAPLPKHVKAQHTNENSKQAQPAENHEARATELQEMPSHPSGRGDVAVAVKQGSEVPKLDGPQLIRHCLDVLDAAAQQQGRTEGQQPQHLKVGVTIISGFLGSGKTTLLQNIMRQAADNRTGGTNNDSDEQPLLAADMQATKHIDRSTLRIGVLVNDLAAVGIDGLLAKKAIQPSVVTAGTNQEPLGQQSTNASRPTPQPQNAGPETTELLPSDGSGKHALSLEQFNNNHVVAANQNGVITPGRHDSGVQQQHLVELSNGCICCNLRGDMLLAVTNMLCQAPQLNYLVIESTGVGQPHPIAAAFASTDNRGRSLLDYIRVDTMVTVVDVSRFQDIMSSAITTEAKQPTQAHEVTNHNSIPKDSAGHQCEHHQTDATNTNLTRVSDLEQPCQENGIPNTDSLLQTPPLLDPEDCKPLAELLAEQVEYASVIVLNKFDLLPKEVPKEEGDQSGSLAASTTYQNIAAAVSALNPSARQLHTSFCTCDLSDVVNTFSVDMDKLQEAAGWQQHLMKAEHEQEAHRPETEVYGISSMVFQSHIPFHPGRLAAWLQQGNIGSDSHVDGVGAAPSTQDPHNHTNITTGSDSSLKQPASNMLSAQLPSNLLRSKGFFWIASCPQVAWEWSTAGPAASFNPYGEWLSSKLPRRCWPDPGKRQNWDARWGDRCNTLVFIFQGAADPELVKKQLTDCLMREDEICIHQNGHCSEEDEAEDSLWSDREAAWSKLPGSDVWSAILPD